MTNVDTYKKKITHKGTVNLNGKENIKQTQFDTKWTPMQLCGVVFVAKAHFTGVTRRNRPEMLIVDIDTGNRLELFWKGLDDFRHKLRYEEFFPTYIINFAFFLFEDMVGILSHFVTV